MQTERRFITPTEAISLLNDDAEIHTFRNPAGMLVGCDVTKDRIIEILNSSPDKIEIGGQQCRRMKHGLIVDYGGFLFIETNEEKLNAFDPINSKS